MPQVWQQVKFIRAGTPCCWIRANAAAIRS